MGWGGVGWGDTFMNLTYHMKEKAILKGDSTANETENCKDFSNESSFECSCFYLGDGCTKKQSRKGKLANIY